MNSNPTFSTMGLDDDGDPPAGRTEEAEDNGDVGMDIEETTDEFLRNLEKNSGSTSLQKEAARSACTSGTSGTTTATGTTTGIEEEGMELELGQTAETPRWQLRKNSSTSTSTSTSATIATGMKKIDEEDEEAQEEEEEADELQMKTRNWRKINLSFAVELVGDDGDDIRSPEQKEGNDNKMKHHPIMSKIAKFMIAIEKKCNTVKIMSSKKQMVLDSKACIDSWSINEVNFFSPIQLQRKETEMYK
jgi:hypothetical protein